MGKKLPNYMCKTLFNPNLTINLNLRTHVRRGNISYTPRMKTVASCLHWLEKKVQRIQDGDSVSSINQKFCWDAGATLGRTKAPRRIKNLTPWTPRPYKASPCHVTLRKQEGSLTVRCQLQTCLGDIQQANRLANKQHAVFPQPPLG
jgi:hypothetical protein